MKNNVRAIRQPARKQKIVTYSGVEGLTDDRDTRHILSSIEDTLTSYRKDNDTFSSVHVRFIGTEKECNKNHEKYKDIENENRKITEDDCRELRGAKPRFKWKNIVLPECTRETILTALSNIEDIEYVYEKWGIKEICGEPRTALNFYGESGTGKTATAHAIADYLGNDIVAVSYSDITSKYFGEGARNVKRIFGNVSSSGSTVLFIDEADSLLSRRISDTEQASAQAINSMRSELLIALEEYEGIVIFSTNMAGNYDKAFSTRLKHIKFDLPDREMLEKLWDKHLVAKLPRTSNVNPVYLADKYQGLCGREIRDIVRDAAFRARGRKSECIDDEDIQKAYVDVTAQAS